MIKIHCLTFSIIKENIIFKICGSPQVNIGPALESHTEEREKGPED